MCKIINKHRFEKYLITNWKYFFFVTRLNLVLGCKNLLESNQLLIFLGEYRDLVLARLLLY